MIKSLALLASTSLIAGALVTPVPQKTGLEAILDDMVLENTEPVAIETLPSVEEKKETTMWVCKSCGSAEQTTLAFLQTEAGITDRAALATILGNIQQESRFLPNICEGGARVSYQNCHRGGFGLIQFTTIGRYRGLGQYANRTNGDPSTLKTQLGYIITEPEWKAALPRFQNPGQSISYYMDGAYRWLGWGIHGARTQYAQNYYNRLALA